MTAILENPREIRPPGIVAPSIDRPRRLALAEPDTAGFALKAPAVSRPPALQIILRFALTAAPLFACDAISLCLSGSIALALLGVIAASGGRVMSAWTPLILIPLMLAYWPAGLYPGIGVHPVIELRQVSKVNMIAFLAAALAGYVTRHDFSLPGFFVASWLVSLPLVPFSRIVTRKLCARRSWWGFPALVISSGQAAQRVIRTLIDSPHGGLRPVAVTDPADPPQYSMGGLPLLDHESATAFIHDHAIRYAVVSLPEMSRGEMSELLSFYSSRVPHVLVVSNLSELPSLWSTARSCGGLNGTEFRNGLMLLLPRLVKRAIDLAVASVALVIALPLLGLIAALVKLSSRGPVFYGHTRLGLQGLPFRAWKFRSMHSDGDRILRKYLANNPDARAEWETDHKLREDPRVTPVGGVLRRLSLDELPQLWNVLRGDMSLVGPRPIVNDEIEKYGRVFHLYAGVKPGITGLWQVSGRNQTTYEQRVRMDQYYVRNWSPWLDIYILCKTISVVIKREGAY